MALKLSNNGTSTLASSISDAATSLSVQAADASLFPTLGAGDWFPVTVRDASGNMEVMKCTARASAVLTVTRAQEGTTALAFAAGARIDLRMTAAALAALETPGAIDGATAKAEPVDADSFGFRNSSGGGFVKTTWALLKAALWTATPKAEPIDDDRLLLNDSAAAGATKSVTIAALMAAIWSKLGSLVVGGTAKATPVDADALVLSDSEDADSSKKLTWATIKAALLGYFITKFPRVDASQTFTPAEQAQSRANIGAASSMACRPNLIVNGSMIDSQERGNTLGTANGYYAADQFALFFTAASAGMSIQRIQSRSLAGAANKLEFKTTTAKASLDASDVVTITQNIEGSRPDFVAAGWGAAGAKPFMFRVDQQITAGLYHIHVSNSAGDRHIAVPFTATGTEAIVEVAIPGDETGTWLTAAGTIGMTVDIVLAAGATLTNAAGAAWGGTPYYAASTQFNILGSTDNVARLTDVGLRLNPDDTAIYGPYEIAEVDADYHAERYWEKGTASAIGYSSTGVNIGTIVPMFPKAKAPTIVFSNTSYANANSIELSYTPNAKNFSLKAIGTTPGANSTVQSDWSANSRLSS